MKSAANLWIVLAVSVVLPLVIVGCRRPSLFRRPAAAPSSAPATAPELQQETSPDSGGSFQEGIQGISRITGATLSAASREALERLHISGIVLLVGAVAARFLFGSWRDAAYVCLVGLVPSIGAILLADYGAVVLLFPAAGVVAALALGVKYVVEWRTGYRAFKAVAEVIEREDDGDYSAGKAIKKAVKSSTLSAIVDKALAPVEKLWKADKA
jgi:hypothetical protein